MPINKAAAAVPAATRGTVADPKKLRPFAFSLHGPRPAVYNTSRLEKDLGSAGSRPGFSPVVCLQGPLSRRGGEPTNEDRGLIRAADRASVQHGVP